MSEQTAPNPSFLDRLDAWMAANPWHPRVAPFAVYIVVFALMGVDGLFETLADMTSGIAPLAGLFQSLTDAWRHPAIYPTLYIIQCGLVVAMLWRYRRLTPELNIKFHWLAIPTGVFLVVAWVLLGFGYNLVFKGEVRPDAKPHMFQAMAEASLAMMWFAVVLRLLGMSLVVPLFEELFIRSACLRGLHRARPTGVAIIQLLCDMPMIGEWLMHTKLGQQAMDQPAMFTKQLRETPVGAITVFSVAASTFVFMISHNLRDWAGCIACGVVWCWLVWHTNRPSLPEHKRLGIGPIVWSHGITNALLWGYTVWWNDWQFL